MSNAMDNLSREVEQIEAASETAAKVAMIFYKTLMAQGLDKAGALELTKVWIGNLAGNSNKK